MKYFIYHSHNTFTIHVPNLITVGFLIFINYPRIFLHLKNARMDTRLITHRPTFQRYRGQLLVA
jgi:hypothetical protein